MPLDSAISALLIGLSPADLLRRWSAHRPLAALVSSDHDRPGTHQGRWSILAEPRGWLSLEAQPASPPRWGWIPTSPLHTGADRASDRPSLVHNPPVAAASSFATKLNTSSSRNTSPLSLLRSLLPPSTPHPDLPFVGGFIASFSYELGHLLEPAASSHPRFHPHWPLALLAWCPAALIHDRLTNLWSAVNLQNPADLAAALPHSLAADPAGFDLGPLRAPTTARARYEARVADAIDRIRAGEVYQVNLAHRLRATFAGSARALAAVTLGRGRPPFAAYLDAPDTPDRRRALVSASPELFLDYRARTRAIITRPIKGTRPASADPAELLHSAKDRAELDMIVDLMRNDLGRVCEFGSVRVTDRRTIERHAAVLQAVATITGTLRGDLDAIDLIEAAFPAGSITGAPKVQAMRTIEALEPLPRGPYCGSIGYLSACGNAALSVAIRTGLITGEPAAGGASARDGFACARLDYHVGAGIVADSDPAAEWRETLAKARAWRALATIKEAR